MRRSFVSRMLLLVSAAAVALPAAAAPQGEPHAVSRQEAADIVVRRLVDPATLDRPVVAWLTREPLSPGAEVWPFDVPEETTTVERPTWFAWIDDHPQAFFAHPTRFVFIDAESGAVEVKQARWWPVLDGESLFMSREERTDLELIVYSELHLRKVEP